MIFQEVIVEELHTLIDYGVDATGNHIYKCHCGYTRDEWGSGGSNVIMGKKEDEETE